MAVFTKNIFRTSDMKERLIPTYLAAPEESGQMDFPFIGEMVKNHRKCPYLTLLRQICPCSQDLARNQMKRKKKKQTCPATSENVPVKDVFLFVRRVFLKVIPLTALGNIRNRNTFMKLIMELLSIPVNGKMSVIFMVANIRTKFIVWLKSYSQKEQRSRLQDFVTFIVSSFIGPLIQSFFYVTQAGSTNELIFYRKKIWHRLLCAAYKKFRKRCKLKFVTEEWVEHERKKGKCLGIFYPHFLPKKDSLRPIVRCSRKANGRATINDHLRSLHLVLSSERKRQPQNFGASILGMDEFHQRWKKYHLSMHNKCLRRYYFVKTDLLNCFDNIDPVLLFKIIRHLMKKSYTVYKYKRLAHVKGNKQTIFFESVEEPKVISNRTAQSIDCLGSYEIKSDVLLEKLYAFLFCNIVKLGPHHFIQTVGIPQGARISSLLCAAYFGYMDKTACAEFLGPHNFLIRMTDDMLFVTPHKETAKMFLQLMLDGVPAMKCISNFSKCLINFSYCHSILGEVPSICDDEPVKYCGICINPKTLEISVDYSNFKGKDRVPVSWELIHNSGAVLQKKILNSVNPQSFSILFDTDINSQQQINYNILCKFAVCSVKFHYLVMKLPAKQRALNNPSFFTRVVQSLPDHFYMLVTKALKKVSKDFKKDLSLPVSKATLRSLCNLTFLYKLQRHHAAYAFVIDNLLRVEKRKRLNSELRKKLSVVFDSINLKY